MFCDGIGIVIGVRNSVVNGIFVVVVVIVVVVTVSVVVISLISVHLHLPKNLQLKVQENIFEIGKFGKKSPDFLLSMNEVNIKY
jgi:type IV secretory pathway VirB3-like protein